MKKVDSMNILDIIENIKIKTIYGSLPTKVNKIHEKLQKVMSLLQLRAIQ